MIPKLFRSSFQVNSLTQKLVEGFLSAKKQVDHDLIFIRHAESEFNVACEQYRLAHKIPYVWKELCNHEGFDQKVLFNMKYIDCPITDKGRKECIKKRSLLQNEKIDCVLVSPQMRTLQTCDEIFKYRQIPIVVQPLLMGPLRSCSDISLSMEYKKLIFPHFNFSRTESCDELWFLDYLPKEQQQICYNAFEEKGLVSSNSKRAEILELLKSGKISQDAIQYRKRVQTLKNKIFKYKNIFPKIAIVSHYYTIQYVCAKEFMQCGTPKYYLDVQNCRPYYVQTKNLLPKGLTKADQAI